MKYTYKLYEIPENRDVDTKLLTKECNDKKSYLFLHNLNNVSTIEELRARIKKDPYIGEQDEEGFYDFKDFEKYNNGLEISLLITENELDDILYYMLMDNLIS